MIRRSDRRVGGLAKASAWQLLAVIAVAMPAAAAVQMPISGSRIDPNWDTSKPRGETRTIDFAVDEGTGMSVDIARQGQWIVFDLLANIYRLPATGGTAVNLTGNSGIALNFHPAISPDSTKIAFVSDRSGQNNLWLMDADGQNVRPIFLDPLTKISEPRWTPDGRAIVAVRGFATPGRGWHRTNTQIWMFPVDGGEPRQLVAGQQEQYNSPSVSPDGGSVLFHVSYFARNRFGTQVGHRLQRLSLNTGQISDVRPHSGPVPTWRDYVARTEDELPNSGPAETAPLLSPDGRTLAFAREASGVSARFRGHDFGPATALVLRDVATGRERVLVQPITQDLTRSHAMFSYRTLPAFAWSSDSSSILLSLGGNIVRVDVASGRAQPIPFTARVHREISQMTRNNLRIDDRTLAVRMIQWPSASPDGTRIVFAAIGKLWVEELASGTTRLLMPPPSNTVQATPAWSPDGKRIAFATWSDTARGQLWSVKTDGTDLEQLTKSPGEYAYPAWRPDGNELVVAAGPGPTASDWQPWRADGAWRIVRVSATGGRASDVVVTNSIPQASYGLDGRINYAAEADRVAAADLHNPWPGPEALKQTPQLWSVMPDGSAPRLVAELTYPQLAFSRGPIVSPGGQWLAYEADHEIFVVRRPTAGPWRVDPDVNAATSAARRVSVEGGAFSSWRDGHTLQFASGNRYYSYDVLTGERRDFKVELTVPRFGGSGKLALTNARIIPVVPAATIERGTITIENARITCVGKCPVDGQARTIDMAGKTIMPGLIDVHEHETTEETEIVPLRRPASLLSLAYGVTTIVDPATDPLTAFPIAEMIESGATIGPRTFSSADLVIFEATAMGQRIFINSLRDAELEVNRRVDWGAVTIKNYRTFSRDAQQKLIAAALERGVTVTGEGGPLFYDLSTIMDGQTGWEHIVADLPVYHDFTTFAGLAGITYSPTVNVAGTPNGAQDFWRPRADLINDDKYRRFAPLAYVEQTSAGSQARSASATGLSFSFPIVAEGLKDILAAGGHGAIGEHGEQWGIGSHWELWSYGTALSPSQVLRIATIDGARFVGLEHELGSIEPGKIADLLILDADPLKDIHNSLKISAVMKAGVLYDGKTLDELWPVSKPLGDLPWQHRTETPGTVSGKPQRLGFDDD